MSAPTINAPMITQAPRRLTLYQHHRATPAEIPATFARAFEALYAYVGEIGIQPAGPPFAIYHDEPEPGGPFSMDICVPVSSTISPPTGIEFKELPASRVVSLLHVGPYETLEAAYATVKAFIAEHDLTPISPPREFYFSPPDVPPDQVQTLLEVPVG